MVFTKAMLAIANKELSDKLKSRWVMIIGAGFALFTLIIAYFGSAPAGIAGFRALEATIASLTSLVTYFIPILALTLGGGLVADEREKGTLELFLSAPISVGEFLVGKFAGLVMALTLATVIGLGLAGAVLLVKTGMEGAGALVIFIINSVFLGVIFLSLSLLISILLYERTKVIALTVFLWLFFTVIYDLGLVGLLILTKGKIGSTFFSVLMLLNPVDLFRILNFISIGEFKILVGLASVEFPSFMRLPFLFGLVVIWMLGPLGLSYIFFKRKYTR